MLAALGYGASGTGESQLLKFFRLNGREQFLQILEKINIVLSGPDIEGGNAIFFDKQYSGINPKYYHEINKYVFLAQSDFSNSHKAAEERNK